MLDKLYVVMVGIDRWIIGYHIVEIQINIYLGRAKTITRCTYDPCLHRPTTGECERTLAVLERPFGWAVVEQSCSVVSVW